MKLGISKSLKRFKDELKNRIERGKTMKLSEAKPGTLVRVDSIEASELKTRLMSMGMVKGTKVKVLRTGPMGDPLVVFVRSFKMAIRLQDAEKINVTEVA